MLASLRRIPLLLIGFTLFTLSCNDSGEGKRGELPEFKAYLGTKPQALSRLRPAFLAEFGRHGHTLDGLDLAAKKAEIALLKKQFESIKSLPNPSDSILQIQRQAQLWMLERKIAEEAFLLYRDPLNPVEGFHVRLLKTFHDQYIGSKEETEAYNARMKMIPKQIKEVISLLQDRHAAGIRSPQLLLKAAKKQLEGFYALPINQNPLYRGLAIKLNQVDVTSLNLYQASDYLEVSEMNLQKFVQPAYKKLLAIVEELLAESTEGGPIYPDGDAYYLHQLHKHYGKIIQPDALFKQGVAALDSLKQSLEILEAGLDLSPVPAAEEVPRKFNRLEQIQIFAAKMRKAREQMIGLFDKLPPKSPEIMAKPQYLSHDLLLDYEPASLDKLRKARVVVDLDRWQRSSEYEQKSLLYTQIYPGLFTLHEGSEATVSYISPDGFLAWELGWQNYVLQLADKPLYIFTANPELKRGFLKGQIQLVLAMLTDLGIYYKKWSTDQTDHFLKSQGIRAAEKRQILLLKSYSNPGALGAGWVGAREFQRLANYTEERFSPKINVKSFHEKCRKNGPLPWFLLQKSIGVYENRNLAR